MKSSIKLKLFTAFSGLIVFYVLLSWVLNNEFLVKYYYYNKDNTLINNYEYINKIYQGKPFEILLELERLERTEGLHIVIQNSSFKTTYDSSFKAEEYFHQPQSKKFPNINKSSGLADSPDSQDPSELIIEEKAVKVTQGNPIIVKSTDRRLNSEFINLVGLLNNGDYVFLSTPVVAIQESASIANKMFLVTGLFTILIGMIFIFLFSSRFTKPIFQLNEIAQRMSKLDFSKKYLVKTYDEIGELGESINSLSNQLEKSISELRQANEKLMEDIEKERKIDDMRKEFISNVSHELKTPIALIQGYAEGLKVNVNENEEDKNFYCEVIIDETGKMNRLVKQLLDLSQIDAGYGRIERTDFDLCLLIEHVLRKNALLLKENNITLLTELNNGFTVNADIDRVEQVLVNYLINAINHVDQKKEIKVKTQKAEDKIRISFFNSGTRISEEDQDKIWTSFYKVDKARTRAYGGTGLGLSIVRAIQELHENRYGVENKENGVEFWFEVDLTV